MIEIEAKKGIRYFMLSLRRGDFVIESIREFVKKHNIDAGFIISGIGSMDICILHYIKTTGLPPKDKYITIEGPLEIGGFQGSIAGGEPHIHIVVYDQNKDLTFIGHLEEGSRCCYRIEFGIIALTGVETKRIKDKSTGLPEIIEV